MITYPSTAAVSDPVQRMAARIAERLAVAGGAYRRLDGRLLLELAHAVAWDWMEATGRPDAAPIEWLPRACRALSACGESEMAAALMLFDTQLVWPAEWTFHGDAPFWIIDCDRLALRETEKLALILNRVLSIILARMAPLWDATDGNGALGLRHAGRLVKTTGQAGRGGRRRGGTGALGELQQFCSDCLAALGRRRGWLRSPQVLLLPS